MPSWRVCGLLIREGDKPLHCVDSVLTSAGGDSTLCRPNSFTAFESANTYLDVLAFKTLRLPRPVPSPVGERNLGNLMHVAAGSSTNEVCHNVTVFALSQPPDTNNGYSTCQPEWLRDASASTVETTTTPKSWHCVLLCALCIIAQHSTGRRGKGNNINRRLLTRNACWCETQTVQLSGTAPRSHPCRGQQALGITRQQDAICRGHFRGSTARWTLILREHLTVPLSPVSRCAMMMQRLWNRLDATAVGFVENADRTFSACHMHSNSTRAF